MYCKCCGQLFIVPVTLLGCWEVLQHTPWQDWCLWGLRSAGERHTRLCIVEIDKIGTKYSMHKIAHAKHWELHTSSSEGCTAYWNMNRQTDRMKGQIFVSKQAWMTATSVIKWTALCVLCTVEIYIKSADRQDKALVSGSKGDLIDSTQWCYQMKCNICVQAHLRAKTMLNFLLSVNAP